MNLAAAFGSLVGVGAATLISVKLGQKDYDTAQRVFGKCVCIKPYYQVSAFTLVVTSCFSIRYFTFFGGSDETVRLCP